MFNRLKSLPLTIVLTLLIWLYADSQVRTAPEGDSYTVKDVPISLTGPPDLFTQYLVRVEPLRVSVTITGPHDRVAALRNSASEPREDNPVYLILLHGDALGQSTQGTMRALAFPLEDQRLAVHIDPPEAKFWLVEKNKRAAQTSP